MHLKVRNCRIRRATLEFLPALGLFCLREKVCWVQFGKSLLLDHIYIAIPALACAGSLCLLAKSCQKLVEIQP